MLAAVAPRAAGYVLARPLAPAPGSSPVRSAVASHVPRAALPSMNLADRFVRLVKSNVNSALGALEDPEKVLEQAVNDMQRDLTKVRQAYAEVKASSTRAEEQMKLAEVCAAGSARAGDASEKAAGSTDPLGVHVKPPLAFPRRGRRPGGIRARSWRLRRGRMIWPGRPLPVVSSNWSSSTASAAR